MTTATKITRTTTYNCGCTEIDEVFPVGKNPETRNAKFACDACLTERQNRYQRKDKFVAGCTACSLVRDGYHEYEHSHGAA